jgi:hypothetical protein
MHNSISRITLRVDKAFYIFFSLLCIIYFALLCIYFYRYLFCVTDMDCITGVIFCIVFMEWL